MARDLARHCGVEVALLLAACLLTACTYLQERTLHQYSGVVLDADTKKSRSRAL